MPRTYEEMRSGPVLDSKYIAHAGVRGPRLLVQRRGRPVSVLAKNLEIASMVGRSSATTSRSTRVVSISEIRALIVVSNPARNGVGTSVTIQGTLLSTGQPGGPSVSRWSEGDEHLDTECFDEYGTGLSCPDSCVQSRTKSAAWRPSRSGVDTE
jgi:hypothetical protein